ncbi:MAG: TonB-dependent receptor [Flavobacteriaceae bacterium]
MKIVFTTCAMCLLSMGVMAQESQSRETAKQESVKDTTAQKEIALQEVFVSALRATKVMGVSYSNVKATEYEARNLGQDLPILLNYLPGVVTTSDAGAGIGYTGIRVRGSDATRVNVTINGIPYNDPESQGTFWVNLPDFGSSVESIQLQRGVGTSTNGAGAFGASLNIETKRANPEASALIKSSVGSFNTLNNSVQFSTGKLNNGFDLSGRLSRIVSDGYIDRASSRLSSYFLEGNYQRGSTQLKGLLFGGHEITYQAWNGIDGATLEQDRTFNPSGLYIDAQGNTQFHDKEEDNYKQDHAQFHWSEELGGGWNSQMALHFTRGRGYFEQYKPGETDADYGIGLPANEPTDLIRRRWLDNRFYGFTSSLVKTLAKGQLIIGGAWNTYEGAHFGEVIWAQNMGTAYKGDRYYEDNSIKTDGNIYAKWQTELAAKLTSFVDLQYRRVGYEANGAETGLVDDTFNFFNPKLGLTLALDKTNSLYTSYAIAHREPNRNDYEGGNPEPERLQDIELGWRYLSPSLQLNTNLFYMRYNNQLVLTGALNDVGAPLRENVGDSYRLGLEIDARWQMHRKWLWQPNLSLSDHRNIDFYFKKDGVLTPLGNTQIAFSPRFIAGQLLQYSPNANTNIGLLHKQVGKQYMGNIDSKASVLEGYGQTDLSVQYQWQPSHTFKNISLQLLVNNIFNNLYVSNGYFYTYDDDFSNPGVVTTIEGAGYYPQAGTNFLLGMSLAF